MTKILDSQDNKAFVWLFQHPEEPRRYMPAEIDVAIIGAGRLRHLYRAVTIGRASAILGLLSSTSEKYPYLKPNNI